MTAHRIQKVALGFLVGCVVATVVGCEEPVVVPKSAADVRYIALEGKISFTNPWFDSPNGQTAHVGLGMDGQGIGRCDKDAHDERTLCVEHAIVPGWHVVSIDLSYVGGDTSKTVHIEERLLAGLNEHVSLDLSKVSSGDPAKFISRQKQEGAVSPCETELRVLAAAPTCTAAELTKLVTQFGGAEEACSSLSPTQELRAGGTASYAYDNMFAIKADRCFTTLGMSRIPRILTATGGDERWWPPGTLKVGSWGWAHDILPPSFDDGERARVGATKAKLAQAKAALARLIERVGVIEDFTVAYELSKKPQAAIDKALRGPLELDPRTATGHRMHLLLHGPDFARSRGDGQEYYDKGLADFVVRGAAPMATLHCGPTQQAALVLGYLYADKKLTREEWAMTQALIQRTPNDAPLVNACKNAVSDTFTSDVSQTDRLRWLAAWDCAATRAAAVRGDAIRHHLSASSTSVPADLRKSVREEFAACVGKDEE